MNAGQSGHRSPTLRDRLAERTRELILEAMADALGEDGPFEFSVFEIARRAGVSPRTIYRHFPTREDMFAALTELVDRRVGFDGYPRRAADIVALVTRLFPAFDAHQELILAQIQTPAGQEMRAHGRRGRAAAMRAAVDELAPGRSEEERAAMAAACHCLMSADAWRRMRTDFELDGEHSGRAAAWALQVLFDAIADPRRPGPGRPDPRGETS
jgi:AcrR family transcriptional regulator